MPTLTRVLHSTRTLRNDDKEAFFKETKELRGLLKEVERKRIEEKGDLSAAIQGLRVDVIQTNIQAQEAIDLEGSAAVILLRSQQQHVIDNAIFMAKEKVAVAAANEKMSLEEQQDGTIKASGIIISMATVFMAVAL